MQIESLAFRQAVSNGDVAWETAIVATQHSLELRWWAPLPKVRIMSLVAGRGAGARCVR